MSTGTARYANFVATYESHVEHTRHVERAYVTTEGAVLELVNVVSRMSGPDYRWVPVKSSGRELSDAEMKKAKAAATRAAKAA